ncbi:dynamin family protein [Spirilliplanes yamanashiensis]|uniref:Isoniazid inducible gene protein IniC n=1 Tax=Spirilliplanes yamanashiensis TaxID=42233 RepID=A0A8J3Y9Z0_9ACTN|nr:dynamin family protein [Spirilliplanes yamanashiensis]MDP9817917.1 energy-coupling factor transporter ATP-binding protein EcfA2 [Spirilliplanes yamanashiensis]GIJ04726.1 isoniazid inducible gene protein IniC [Spirilliplanes yamanashiensis]
MTAGPLSAQVAQLCDAAAAAAGPQAAEQVRHVRRRLDEPLRVAIAGRLKAGKSTLVNAVVGRRIAPTEAGECTRVVTVFRYGTADRVDVVRRDGTRTSLPLDADGMVPQRLGVPPAQVAHVDVHVTSDRLRDLTVVDTPGLSSTSTAVSDRARAVLGAATAQATGQATGAPFDDGIDDDSAAAVSGAEAVVYVFSQGVRADDVQALEAFRAASARLASNPLNALGVLSKVDTLVPGAADPWPVAGPLAADQAQVLRRSVSDVVPVVGLLAETAEAGRLTAADVEALRAIAELPAAQQLLMLSSVDLFTGRAAPVATDRRRRLVELLGLYGAGFALAQLAAQPRLASGDLVRLLCQVSGLPRLRQTLDEQVRWRSDAIKAGWALSALERLAGHAADPADRELLRDAIERLLREPAYHRLRVLEAAQQVATGAVPLPEPMRHELTRLATLQDPAAILQLPQAPPWALADAAVQAATRWRVYAVGGASPAQARVAHVVHRGFHLLSQNLRAAVS